MRRARTAVILGLVLIASAARAASNEDFQGRWVIAVAKPAPWADPLLKDRDAERKRLLGKTIVIGLDFVTGPPDFGCRHARFKTRSDPPDHLFEGGLAEGPNGQTRDARSAARALGITAAKVPTLETSCSEIAYHLTSPTTLMVGLNNQIYILHPTP